MGPECASRAGSGARASSAGLRCWLATATLGLLIAVAPLARAQSECQQAFESWAKLSSARLHIVPEGASSGAKGRGACIPNEAARKELLDGLARARGLCGEASSSSDQSAHQQARRLLSINHGFI